MALTPLNVVGDPDIHDQHSYLIVTGQMDYACDRFPGRKLYSAFKASTIAHGTIKSIDASQALAVPGVKAVITYEDCPIWSPAIFQWGQEVAGVVADDPWTAAQAAALIQVTYNVAKAVIDPDDAMQPDAPLAGVLQGSNTIVATSLTRGSGPQAGLANADVVLQTSQPWSTTYQHNTLETHSGSLVGRRRRICLGQFPERFQREMGCSKLVGYSVDQDSFLYPRHRRGTRRQKYGQLRCGSRGYVKGRGRSCGASIAEPPRQHAVQHPPIFGQVQHNARSHERRNAHRHRCPVLG